MQADYTTLEEQELGKAFLAVMARILYLPSDACRESAIIGLGLWAHRYSQVVDDILGKFLTQLPDLQHGLQVMVRRARKGFILSEPERNSVLNLIESAFANTDYPGDENITRQEHCSECAEIAESFRGKRWQTLTDVKFLEYHAAALSFFKPPAFRYFLPAFIRAALVDPGAADNILDGLIYHLTPPEPDTQSAKQWFEWFGESEMDHFLRRVYGFSQDQKAAIIAYMEMSEHLEDHYFARIQQGFERSIAFWKSYLG